MGRKEWITVTAAQVLTVGSERLSDTLTVRATMPGLCLSPGADRRVGVGGEGGQGRERGELTTISSHP